MSKKNTAESFRVAVRCRPMNEKEISSGSEQVVSVDKKLGEICVNFLKKGRQFSKDFKFDSAYDWNSTQYDLYNESISPVVRHVLSGFNGTIFAFGQSGSGKTYTMDGLRNDPEKRGVIQNCFEEIFNQISHSQNEQYLLKASYLEIYQEEIRDLLSEKPSHRLELKENEDKTVYVKDLSFVDIKSISDFEHVLNTGKRKRSVGSTNMNKHSSRSHAILNITVECRTLDVDGNDHVKFGNLSLVDLAGSESQTKTGAQGQSLKEATKINLSLLALQNVMSALVEGNPHIPYRDSKLTRLLQNSLGGNAVSMMIAHISPASSNIEETLSTLHYASMAKNIKNKPRVNEVSKDAQIRRLQEILVQLDRKNQPIMKDHSLGEKISQPLTENSKNLKRGEDVLDRLTAKVQVRGFVKQPLQTISEGAIGGLEVSSSFMSKKNTAESFRVAIRCRPMNEKERSSGFKQVVSVDKELGEICVNYLKKGRLVSKYFKFDSAYDWNSTQYDLYIESISPVVHHVLSGFNGTIFAFGQSGSGKTYTMDGLRNDPEKKGVIQNCFEEIFNQISHSQNEQYLLKASYLEIYQEEIRDLLSEKQSHRLELKENEDKTVYVKDLSFVDIKSISDFEHVMNTGKRKRSVGSTNMNKHSSRSHAILNITVECRTLDEDGNDHVKFGNLSLVDLAGSESQTKTGAQGQSLKEATKINLSLLALQNVMSALVEGNPHIPYRDSKLTRLLQNSLGGNAVSVMIAHISPASSNIEETLSTLHYASMAKNIKNEPRINEVSKDAQIRMLQEENRSLKKQLEKINK